MATWTEKDQAATVWDSGALTTELVPVLIGGMLIMVPGQSVVTVNWTEASAAAPTWSEASATAPTWVEAT